MTCSPLYLPFTLFPQSAIRLNAASIIYAVHGSIVCFHLPLMDVFLPPCITSMQPHPIYRTA